MAWKHVAGGCMIGEGGYCCDDQYENTKTGKEITIRTTKERHFSLPKRVDSLTKLYSLSGVKKAD